MGKAIGWLKGLFGLQKEKHPSNSGDRKNKIPSCIGWSHKNPTTSPPEKTIYHTHSDDQNKHAVAVAVATAAAADAAVAAAEAAVAVVRLTRQGRVAGINGARENSAAIKIQALFRGYLSRKALKALKSLVKLQALVRGYLVRKDTAETLQGMEALFRAKSSVRGFKFRLQDDKFHSKRSIRTDDARSRRISASFRVPIDERPNPIEMAPDEPKSRLTRANTLGWAPGSVSIARNHIFTDPHHLAIHNMSNQYEFEPRFSTTQNTPRVTSSYGSDSYRSIFEGVSKDDSFASHPGYMANTKSFRAKVRSQSAPKQRPDFGLGSGPKKSVALNEMECGPRIEKSKSPLLEVNHFKNFVMSRIGRSS